MGEHQKQNPPMSPWGNANIGGKLLGNRLSGGQIDVCETHSNPEHIQIESHQIYGLRTILHQG